MTFTHISTVTLGSSGNIIFDNIPQTFNDLHLRFSLRGNSSSWYNDFVMVTFNDASNGHYTLESRKEGGNYSGGGWNNTAWFVTTPMPTSTTNSDTYNAANMYITNYTNAVNKSVSFDGSYCHAGGDSSARGNRFAGGYWNQNAAVTKISIFGADSNMAANSTVSLYGIITGSGGATVS